MEPGLLHMALAVVAHPCAGHVTGVNVKSSMPGGRMAWIAAAALLAASERAGGGCRMPNRTAPFSSGILKASYSKGWG